MTEEQKKNPASTEKKQQPLDDKTVNQLMQDLTENSKSFNQIKEGVTPIIKRIQKHGIRNFVVTNEFADKMKEISEKMGALNALVPNCVNIQPIRKQIQLTIKNGRELFAKDNFYVDSTSIELIGFKWHLQAKVVEKGFLALYLHAVPPDGFKGNYRIEVDWRFSILNAVTFAGKDLIDEKSGIIYAKNENNYTGWGSPKIAKLEDLLDPTQTFLTPDWDIGILADFTIKSSTLNHFT